jgi:NodT family efflux transporter outer membrane factor (OMF) lipoprotein
MRQPKLASSALDTYVTCVAMFTVNTFRWLERDSGVGAECSTGVGPREPEGIPSICGRGVHSAREGGVKRRRCITARRLVTVLAAAGLAACAVGPDFKRPAIATPSAYRVPEESSESADGVSPSASESAASAYAQRFITGANPADEWWTVFASRDLDAVVGEAIARNHTLAAAQATVAEARELVKAEAGNRYPQLSLDGGAGRQKYGTQFLGPLVNNLPTFSYASAGLTVQYRVDYTGGIARSVEQRAALAQYQRSEADATYLLLTGSVVGEATQVAAARAKIQAVAELLAEDRSNLDLVRTAFANGSVTRVDVLTAESQLATDEALLPPLRQQLSAARHALAVLTAHAPGEWTPPDFSLSALTLPMQLPVSLPSELAHRRPDILAAEAQLHAATAAVGVATANLYPQITLTATGGWQSVPGQALFTRSNAAWSLISGITAPLFDGGTLRAERRAAVDELRSSAARYQEVVLESFGQVADALDALTHDGQLVAAQNNALASATSNVELARESYAVGNSGILQVIDAQRRRLDAQVGFLHAEAQQYLDTTQLFLALGGGDRL